MAEKLSPMQKMLATSYLSGTSAAYIEDLYESYLADPHSVDAPWRHYFANLPNVNGAMQTDVSHAAIREHFLSLAKTPKTSAVSTATANQTDAFWAKQAKVMQLINAYRVNGHLHAKLDPLKLMEHRQVATLSLAHYGLDAAEVATQFNTDSPLFANTASLQAIYEVLNQTYCGSVGFEYMYISEPEEVAWLQQQIESSKAKTQLTKESKLRILQDLVAAEGLERYLGRKYVGQKRFSLEGGETLIPMLNGLIQNAATQEVKEVLIGMAHRGRLNVLVNILGKEPKVLFQEFEGKFKDEDRLGDVKYHLGFSSDVQIAEQAVHLVLAFNPSHLEIVSPVVEGSARARQQRRTDQTREQVLPVILHGDAAFAGQGVVMETFNMSQARGYTTGGTIHIVINNQVGFTTSNPQDARSTLYCTDVAKMVQAPVFHVNADDPEAAYFVTQLALAYRMKFKKDVVIDLICYRRHGHNEADEPSATQPLMYQVIKKHPSTLKLYADQLAAEGILAKDGLAKLEEEYRKVLDLGHQPVVSLTSPAKDHISSDWTPYFNQAWMQAANTGINHKQLAELGSILTSVPDNFKLQAQVAREFNNRKKMAAAELAMNWGFAENMAYASLLAEGFSIRISGQDVGRGTFAHRHAVVYEQSTGQAYIPIQQAAAKAEQFTIIDSVLSEEAVLAFEYGFASTDPKTLVIWEAQFGDFVNGAQVVIDQFISSGEQKWGRLCGLVMLLPHGHEGAGPEHTSARLERFLQLCAQDNMQVCVPTTPAQAFHMLRRQILRTYRKPLIVMTPKSLLRHKLAVSNLTELSQGSFQVLIDEIDDIKQSQIKRIILCSGKVYYDLLEKRRELDKQDVAIIRLEQLYPFPTEQLTELLAKYQQAKQVVWCQEEPHNQGAWFHVNEYIQACLSNGQKLSYAGRSALAAPSEGHLSKHIEQQELLIKQALGIN